MTSGSKLHRVLSSLPFAGSNGQSSSGGNASSVVPSGDELDLSGEESEKHELLRGRYEFAQSFSDLAKGKRNWQITAFVSMALLAVSLFGLVTLATSSRITPYVVEVNELGQARAFGPATKIDEASERIVVAELSSFIRNVRSVYSDPQAQKDMIYRAYSHAIGEARSFLESYFSDPDNDPRLLSGEFSRTAQVQSVTRLPDSNTYKVKWRETKHFPDGSTENSAWEAYLTVEQIPPESADMLKYNPLGITVTDMSWSKFSGSGLSYDSSQ